MATTAHRPGSLYRLISKFAVMGINLTKLESRPIPGKDFEFKFYFDMEASVYNDDVLDLWESCQTLRNLLLPRCVL